ncbi:MAG: secondary thiamine-phosphate synthase enzyme YjbQ [Nanoarchaeota archaeon]|nr:secondary thiamine-phosphate synthase enzyme YjbQ [Nanoarchaeota archaeon]
MAVITVSTSKRYELVDVTEDVRVIVKESGVKEGLCNVYAPHATAAITINENADPNIRDDISDALSQLIKEGCWRHDRIDNNAASHIKAAIVGASETIPIVNGELAMGTWQDIFICDFDGPRTRKVIVTVLPKS